MAKKIDAYVELKLMAQDLEEQGVPGEVIADALMCIGINAACRLDGPEAVIAYLRKMIGVLEAKAERLEPVPTAH